MPGHFHEPAFGVAHGVGLDMDDPLRAVRTNDAMIDAVRRAGAELLDKSLARQLPFVGMEEMEKTLMRDLDRTRIKAENAKGLIRPARRMILPVLPIR